MNARDDTRGKKVRINEATSFQNTSHRKMTFYCSKHSLPWCNFSQKPCYFCYCNICEKLPVKYRNFDDAQCSWCEPISLDEWLQQ